MRTLVLSDLHLGSRLCRTTPLLRFLSTFESRPPDCLILAGDTFDNLDFRRLAPTHLAVLTQLRRLETTTRLVWLEGNHDGPAQRLCALLGSPVWSTYRFTSGSKHFLCLHGHIWDPYLAWPRLVWLGDRTYRLLGRLDGSGRLPAWGKRASKQYGRCVAFIAAAAEQKRQELGIDAVICGHSHMPVATATYYNSGSWTESPATYLDIVDGTVALCEAG